MIHSHCARALSIHRRHTRSLPEYKNVEYIIIIVQHRHHITYTHTQHSSVKIPENYAAMASLVVRRALLPGASFVCVCMCI